MKCLTCKKSVAKNTVKVQFKREPTQNDYNSRGYRHVYIGDAPWPQTIDDCRKYTNQRVIAVSRLKKYNYDTEQWDDLGVDTFQEWDGLTYIPRFGFFCSIHCAGHFGKAAAEALKTGKLIHR